jgi:hypothetical protein
MIINKPQQFIIYNDPVSLNINNLPADIKNRIFRIFRVLKPTGGSLQSYSGNSISQFSSLENNNIYLVFSRPGQLGYEIPGAVSVENYDNSNKQILKENTLVLNSNYPLVISA